MRRIERKGREDDSAVFRTPSASSREHGGLCWVTSKFNQSCKLQPRPENVERLYGPLGRALCALLKVSHGHNWGRRKGEGKRGWGCSKELVGLYSKFVKTITGDQRLSCAGSIPELCTVRCSIATWEPGWPCFGWYC